MNIAIFEYAMKALSNMTEMTKKTMDASDPEKYAEGVRKLNYGVDESYAKMREIVSASDKYSDDEKIEKLKEVAELEMKSKERCAEAIKGNREHVAKISLEVLKGFLTCGISFTPMIVKEIKKAVGGKAEVKELETAMEIVNEISDVSDFTVYK